MGTFLTIAAGPGAYILMKGKGALIDLLTQLQELIAIRGVTCPLS